MPDKDAKVVTHDPNHVLTTGPSTDKDLKGEVQRESDGKKAVIAGVMPGNTNSGDMSDTTHGPGVEKD